MDIVFWAKLWIDILDDTKISKMDDWLFRRFIFFLLVAKESDEKGLLPNVDDLAWRIRENRDDVRKALLMLRDMGIVVEVEDEVFLIKNFEKRQERVYSENPEAVRKRDYRNKLKQMGQQLGHVPEDMSVDTSVSVSDSFNTINNTMSLNKTLNASAEKKVMYTLRNAEGVYCRVTGLAGVTPDKMPYMEIILGMLNKYGEGETIERLGKALSEWTGQVAKNGKPYSKLNPKWIELADAGETIGIKPEDKYERAARELEEIARRNQYVR